MGDVRSLVVGQQSLRYSPVYGLFVPGTVQGRLICCARETACCVGELPWSDSKDSLWVANINDDLVGSGSAKQGTGLTEPTWAADGTTETEQQLAHLFAKYGEVRSVSVRRKHSDIFSTRATHQSWAVVKFATGARPVHLNEAIADAIELGGHFLIVKHLRKQHFCPLAQMRADGTQ